MNFVEKLLEITSIVESPESFLRWSAYATIGAVMRHNVYIDMPSRMTKILPNLYVLLVGDSGSTRKSTPLSISRKLLKQVGCTKVIEGRTSIQGVLKELAEIYSIKTPDGISHKIEGGGALLFSGELAAFFVKDPDATAILTDLYDSVDSYDRILASQERIHIDNISLSLLSASNEAFLQDMYRKTDIYGGLVGRTIYIMETRARHKHLGLDDPITIEDWSPLVTHLRRISKLRGPVEYTKDAKDYLKYWYENTDFVEGESKTGFEPRAHTYAMKLSIILAACEEGFDRKIKVKHCEDAINLVTSLRRNYYKLVALGSYTQDSTKQAVKDILLQFWNAPGESITRVELMQRLFGRVDSDEMDKAITTLQQSSFIETCGNSLTFKLTEIGKKKVLSKMENKNETVN